MSTGNVFTSILDYTTTGQNPLELIRYYNSLSITLGTPAQSSLGTNWRTNFDRSLNFVLPSNIQAFRPDGQTIPFSWTGSSWVTDSDVDYSLSSTGTGWTLTGPDNTVETYNVLGQLTMIAQQNGYVQELHYGSKNTLASVTDSYDRLLTFTPGGNGLIEKITTPDDTSLTYAYTIGSGTKPDRLTTVTYSTSPATKQTYLYGNSSFPYAMTTIVDEDNNQYSKWSYDSLSRGQTSQQGSGANLTTFTYNANGTTTVTNALGVADTYTFTTLQGVSKVTKISRAATATTAPATQKFGYDSNGYLNSKTDWNGNKTTYVNDSHGDPTTVNEAVGSSVSRTTEISYDPTWVHEPHEIIKPSLTSTFVYDDNGNVHTRTDLDTTTNTAPYSTKGQARVTTWNWNSTGEMTSVQLPRTDVTAETSFTYDSSGALIQTKDALGHLTKITSHTGGGLPLTIVDPNTVTTTLAYDARLNLHTSKLTTSAGVLTTTWTHDAANNLTAEQLPDGSGLKYTYDNAHRLTGITDLFGNSINYTLDALGDRTLVETKNPTGTVTRKHSASFDSLGRMLTNVGGEGQTTTYTYDGNGNVRTVAPPAPSGKITYGYDALNRRQTVEDPAPGGTTTIAYDAHDRILSVKDANGNTTAYVYDGFGDRTQTTSPDSGVTVAHYDGDRNITEVVKPGPLTDNMTYDALDRPLKTIYPADATLAVSRSYDQSAGHGDGIGRLTSVTDQVGSLSLVYDERGNVTSESRSITGEGTLVTGTTFDKASRVTQIAYPSGTQVDYARDIMGRITGITTKVPGSNTAIAVVSGVSYEPFGPVAGLTFGNGVTGEYGFDLDYRPTTRLDKGKAAIQNLTYGYYTNDSVEEIADAVNPANTQTLAYDALDRLTSGTSGKGGYGAIGYGWDPVSNIETQMVNGTKTTYGLVSKTNKLASETTGSTTDAVSSTAAGNISSIKAGSTTLDAFTYNQANQLASAQTSSTFATYKYDFSGQRLEKARSGDYPIVYQYSRTGGELLSENDLHKGQTADYIYLNGRPIGEVNPTTGTLYFTHTDRLGNPRTLTGSNQAIAWNALYQPFGGAAFTGTLATQSLRLPGQEFDPETGLYHNGFRDYTPGLTRYIEGDPIGLAGGTNMFEYVQGNPFKYVDSLGLSGEKFPFQNAVPPSFFTTPPPPNLPPSASLYDGGGYIDWEKTVLALQAPLLIQEIALAPLEATIELSATSGVESVIGGQCSGIVSFALKPSALGAGSSTAGALAEYLFHSQPDYLLYSHLALAAYDIYAYTNDIEETKAKSTSPR